MGALTGLIAGHLKAKAEQAERAQQRTHEDRLSERNQLVEIRKAEADADRDLKPVTFTDDYEKTRPMFYFLGPLVTIRRKRTREKIPASRRTISNARIAGMCAFALCGVLLACGLDPSEPLWTIPASDQPDTQSIGWGLYTWSRHRTEAVAVTAGHFILPLSLPIVFIVSAYTTGLPFRK